MLSCSRAAARQALRAAAVAHGQQAGRRGMAAVSTYHSSSSVASSSRFPSTMTTTSQSAGRRRTYDKRDPGVQDSDRRKGGDALAERPFADYRMLAPDAKDVISIQRWFRSVFPPLSFPDDMALQLVTHESYDHGREAGHNRRLAFIGRRSMEFYLNLFLAQHPGNEALLNTNVIDDLLHTSMLGDHVGRALRLVEVMRWTPAFSDNQRGAKEMGLFKVRGVAVEALLGAVYHQHGAQTARHFFSAHILPNLHTFSEAEAERLRDAIAEERREGLAFLESLSSGITGQATAAVTASATTTAPSVSVQADDELMNDYARHTSQRYAAGVESART